MAEQFPEFWNTHNWRIVKNSEILWLKLPIGVEKRIGTTTVYERIANPNEKVLEINIFERGAVAHVWILDADSESPLCYSRLLKDGKWIYGPKGEVVYWREVLVNGRFCGVKIMLEIEVGREEFIVILKDGKPPG